MTDEEPIGEHVRIVAEGDGVATLRVDRPPVNALTVEVWEALGQAARRLAADDGVGAVVLWGGPKVFAPGADVKELASRSHTEMQGIAPRIQEAFRALAQLPQVTIAAINGYALGGGCELAMMCDFILAADTAKFGQPEIKIGAIPGAGGTQRLTRFVGKSKAMEMCLTGRMMDADEAERSGLVSRVVPADQLLDEAMKTAGKIAGLSRITVPMCKESVNRAYETTLSEGVRFERRVFHSVFSTEDQKEGMAAFVEKRDPQWRHR